MSDASAPVRKISREGIVLIKSFEGFRPRATRRADGGWVIGYGHTLSAREGASVSEADAELLLRYDLLPVEKKVNETARGIANQHQFDALVSFAFSVGSDRFDGSDVLARMNAGAAAEAAEAMMAWPEPATPELGLRRRAAERALFIADPDRPVSLAELLVTPLPARPEPTAEPEPEDAVEPPTPGQGGADPREAAVAALLGEAAPTPSQEDRPPTHETAEPDGSLAESPTVVPTFGAITSDEPHPEPTGGDVVPANDLEPASEEPVSVDGAVEPLVAEPGGEALTSQGPSFPGLAPEEASTSIGEAAPAAAIWASPAVLAAQRYAPYGTPIVGPLPFLEPIQSAGEPSPTTADPFADAPLPSDTLVLTSPEDAPQPVLVRPTWTLEERSAPEPVVADEGLFGEELTLTQGGQPTLRHEIEPVAPVRFDWSETGAFIIMGAVGLTAFGASMAAFRLASEQTAGGDETSIIGWVLAVIGVACVGVSSLNLYRRFGLPGGDR